MKELTTKKSELLLEEVKVNGKDIYINASAGNMMKMAGMAKLDFENPEEIDKMAGMLFTADSYELVSMLDIEDFYIVLDLAKDVLDKQEKSIESRFKAE